MINYPKISIVIPTLNEEATIDSCLKSIFSQKYKGKFEVIVVDDESSDKTLEIVKKYPVIVLKNGNKSAEIGKMIGLKKSTGKYFLFLDADIDLPCTNWFEQMIFPLEEDNEIIGSFTGYVSYQDDPPLSKFITLDFLQRDPLYVFLTPKLEDIVTEKRAKYWVCKYRLGKMLPAGLCVYRRKEILKTAIAHRTKFMELDNLVILVKTGFNKFAYVSNAGLHHPYLTGIKKLVRSRLYNLKTMYFNQPDKRYWTWIDFSDKKSLLKLAVWVVYSETIIPSLITGLIKSVRNKTWVGLYEPLVNFLTTSVILFSFIKEHEGRSLLFSKNA